MDKLEAIRIDLADYEYAGEGANGMSFNHRRDPDVMLKLYRPGMVQQPLDEMLIARKVFEAGIPTPRPGDYVTDGTRFGVRFRRIRDTSGTIPRMSSAMRRNSPRCAAVCTRRTWTQALSSA